MAKLTKIMAGTINNQIYNEKFVRIAKCPEICSLEHLFWHHISKAMTDVMHMFPGQHDLQL